MTTEMKVPELSDRTDLTLDEAKKEYAWLKSLIAKPDPPGSNPNAPKYGWSRWVVNQIESRILIVQTIIADKEKEQ